MNTLVLRRHRETASVSTCIKMKMVMATATAIFLLTARLVHGQDCQREGTIDCHEARHSRYRTLDGSCNHPELYDEEKAKWNKAYNCFPRIIDADYPDYWGEEIRKSTSGAPLPNARELSNTLSDENSAASSSLVSSVHSQMLMNFGQVLGNEITYPGSIFTYEPDNFLDSNDSKYDCCSSKQNKWPSCAEVRFSKNDPFYSKYKVDCINFSRSQACSICKVKQRSQINMHSPAIDVSTIYGNSLNDSNNKREFSGGRLSLDSMDYPINAAKNEEGSCGMRWSKLYPQEDNLHCFRAGDTYANNNPPKVSLVILLYRQHNRIAKMLSKVNPFWSDEQLFQEARKILGAQMEMITYNEFLYEIMGPSGMKSFSLAVSPSGYIGYDSNIDPSTTAEFTSSVMRSIGHSMINGNLKAKFFNGTTIDYRLEDYYHYLPNFTTPGAVDAYMKGTITEPMKRVDTFFDVSIRGFGEKVAKNGPKYGTDLVTVDIMRGRDFGVPSYASFRKFCFNQSVNSFEDISSVLEPESLSKLQSVYKSVEDIDLYYGLVSEKKVSGSLLGPTGLCLWGREFFMKKFGDRYYFEQGGQSGSFTPAQLASIRQTTLAKIICANGDFYPSEKIQMFVMRLPNRDTNPLINCKDLPDLDPSAWMASTSSFSSSGSVLQANGKRPTITIPSLSFIKVNESIDVTPNRSHKEGSNNGTHGGLIKATANAINSVLTGINRIIAVTPLPIIQTVDIA